MIALIIVLSLTAFFALLLVLPVSVSVQYDKKFDLKVKYAGITVYNTQNPKKQKKEPTTKNVQKSNKPKKDNFVKVQYKQRGLLGTIRYFCDVIVMIGRKLVHLIKKFKVKNFEMYLTVATEDAADTAIQYGTVCAAVYPTLAFIQSNMNFQPKKIDISADFDKKKSEFGISCVFSVKTIYLLITAFSAVKEYLKITKESETNERK